MIKRRTEHQALHKIVFFHWKVIHRINMLDAGIDVQTHRHQIVDSRGDRGRPSDSGSSTGDKSDIVMAEIIITQEKDFFTFNFRPP